MSALDTLLDTTLDDLKDLPSFAAFPAGSHQVVASFGTKEINGKACVTLDFVMKETLELVNSQDKTPKEGDSSNLMFDLANEWGQGNLKKAAAPFMEAFDYTGLRELVEGAQNIECVIVTSLKVDKNDPDKFYLQLKDLAIV